MKLSKSQKKRFRKLRGAKATVCDVCGRDFPRPSPHDCTHPFKPAGWDGSMHTLMCVCTHCMPDAVRERTAAAN